MFKNINKFIPFIFSLVFLSSAILGYKTLVQDTLTMDESVHIPAGYSYLLTHDYRINPEHPPLIKDLSALPLLRLNLKFPINNASWIEGIGNITGITGEWGLGTEFFTKLNTNFDEIVFWARIPLFLLFLAGSFFVFKWTSELTKNKLGGLIASFLYLFSPTLVAHGRLVTNDIGVTIFICIAIYYFIRYLNYPDNIKYIFLTGVALALAELSKFSAIILIPYFFLAVLIIAIIKKRVFRYIVSFILVLIVAYILVGAVYYLNMYNMPVEQQIKINKWVLGDSTSAKILNTASHSSILRPYSYYALGVLMAQRRVMGGGNTYFLGNLSYRSFYSYFPIVFLIKEPLALVILVLVMIFYAIYLLIKKYDEIIKNLNLYLPYLMISGFIILYGLVSIFSNLNIGIRHLIPIYPLLFILLAVFVLKLIEKYKTSIYLIFFILVFLTWYGISFFLAYPYYLSYFNESIGGADNGYKYVVDSNLDWGQDLKRLAKWVEDNNISKIRLSYFGGGSPEYYLGNKYVRWDEPTETDWVAVSVTHLFQVKEHSYDIIEDKIPTKIIGKSIWVYKMD